MFTFNRLRVGLAVVLAASTWQTAHGQSAPVSTDFGTLKTIVAAVLSSGQIQLSCRVEWLDGRVVPFACPLGQEPSSVAVHLYDVSRLLVGSSKRLIVVDPSTGGEVDSFNFLQVAVSSDSRYIAFEKAVGNGADVDDVYLLYDVTQSAASNRTAAATIPGVDVGIPIYPSNTRLLGQYSNGDSAAHHSQSGLVWLAPRLLAFVDRTGDAVSVVLADVTYGVSAATVRQTVLNVSSIVDAANLPSWLSPSQALEPDSIALVSQSGASATIRLHFPAKRWIKVSTFDVVVP
jgi:hypothetical protein